MKINLFYPATQGVDYWSEKPGVVSSILTLARFFIGQFPAPM